MAGLEINRETESEINLNKSGGTGGATVKQENNFICLSVWLTFALLGETFSPVDKYELTI